MPAKGVPEPSENNPPFAPRLRSFFLRLRWADAHG